MALGGDRGSAGATTSLWSSARERGQSASSSSAALSVARTLAAAPAPGAALALLASYIRDLSPSSSVDVRLGLFSKSEALLYSFALSPAEGLQKKASEEGEGEESKEEEEGSSSLARKAAAPSVATATTRLSRRGRWGPRRPPRPPWLGRPSPGRRRSLGPTGAKEGAITMATTTPSRGRPLPPPLPPRPRPRPRLRGRTGGISSGRLRSQQPTSSSGP